MRKSWTNVGRRRGSRLTAVGWPRRVFVHSLTQGIAAGIEWPDLLAATVEPGDDPELLRQTLARARGEERGAAGEAFWFLHWDGRLYLFKTEPSLEKVVQDERALVGLGAGQGGGGPAHPAGVASRHLSTRLLSGGGLRARRRLGSAQTGHPSFRGVRGGGGRGEAGASRPDTQALRLHGDHRRPPAPSRTTWRSWSPTRRLRNAWSRLPSGTLPSSGS